MTVVCMRERFQGKLAYIAMMTKCYIALVRGSCIPLIWTTALFWMCWYVIPSLPEKKERISKAQIRTRSSSSQQVLVAQWFRHSVVMTKEGDSFPAAADFLDWFCYVLVWKEKPDTVKASKSMRISKGHKVKHKRWIDEMTRASSG
jgi:hypothetical protein